eukprot:scaffold14697_cov16-Tisochrysis_lutea.AAC.1
MPSIICGPIPKHQAKNQLACRGFKSYKRAKTSSTSGVLYKWYLGATRAMSTLVLVTCRMIVKLVNEYPQGPAFAANKTAHTGVPRLAWPATNTYHHRVPVDS